MLYNLDEVGKTNWVSYVRHLLCSTGYDAVWLNQYVGDENRFIHSYWDHLLFHFK